MRTAPFLLATGLAGLLVLTGCDQPKIRDTSGAQPAAAAAAGPPSARGIPEKGESAPAPPAWAGALIGQPLRAQFPKTGECKGNTDNAEFRFTGAEPGVQVAGWGWDVPKKARVDRVVLVDRDMRIVGAGEGGLPRPDVPRALPEIADPNTGWKAVTKLTAGPVDAYGLVGDGDAVCVLGHLEF